MGASQFEQSAGALKNKFWLKNLKVKTIYLKNFHDLSQDTILFCLFFKDDDSHGRYNGYIGDCCNRY